MFKSKLKDIFSFKKFNKIKESLKSYSEVDWVDIHKSLLVDFDEIKALSLFNSIIKNKLNFELNPNQIESALKLNKGYILELATGEGKTIAIILSAYLNFLKGEKTYVITANNYLVKRDWKLFHDLLGFLNIQSFYILGEEKSTLKRKIYDFDVIYITINNLIFDYLRDEYKKNEIIKTLDSIIIDEADLVLIDYANSPLYITSNQNHFPIDFYEINRCFKLFKKEDYDINHANKTINLTEKGYHKVEDLSLEKKWITSKEDMYSSKFSFILEQIKNMLYAHMVFKEGVDYIIKSGKIFAVNSKTGRAEGSVSFDGGLLQAIEVKNMLEPSKPSNVKTMITVKTFLSYFNKISGMTGTIIEDSNEIKKVYGVKVDVVETNKPILRYDAPDLFFYEKKYKLDYLVKQVKKIHKDLGIPILIGTLNTEDTYQIQSELLKCGLQVNILTAENEQEEADIIANAGVAGSITISTRIAGRGTDIVLGGLPESYDSYEEWKKEHDRINDLGGLFVFGYERSRQRRIDRQLQGRSGRQGDRGTSVFLISLEDDILSHFNNNGAKRVFEMLDIKESAVESKLNSNIVKKNQKNIENSYYDNRIIMSKFDQENDEYRLLIKNLKRKILNTSNNEKYFLSLIKDLIHFEVNKAILLEKDLNLNVLGINKIIEIDNLLRENQESLENKIFEMFRDNNNIQFGKGFDDYFADIYFGEIVFIWEQMVSSFEAIKKQSRMLKLIGKIQIDEYSKLLENRFQEVYREVNRRVVYKILNNLETTNKMIEQSEEKIRLLSLYEDDITMGYTPILGIGF